METASVIQTLLQVLLPKEIALHFTVTEVKEYNDRIVLTLEELSELLPTALEHADNIALDGFTNAIELQSFPLNGKALYLKLFRRRWKCAGDKKHYSNQYSVHPEGVKATHEFAFFLKEAYGYTPDQYNDSVGVLMRE